MERSKEEEEEWGIVGGGRWINESYIFDTRWTWYHHDDTFYLPHLIKVLIPSILLLYIQCTVVSLLWGMKYLRRLVSKTSFTRQVRLLLPITICQPFPLFIWYIIHSFTSFIPYLFVDNNIRFHVFPSDDAPLQTIINIIHHISYIFLMLFSLDGAFIQSEVPGTTTGRRL